jgi:SAM-dependent methyltransferase
VKPESAPSQGRPDHRPDDRPDDRKYLDIVSHYEACLDRHGDSHLGVDWPKADDATRRYQVMLELIRRPSPATPVSLLDFGCGAGHLLQHMQATGLENVAYSGLDLSPKFIELARRKFPSNVFYRLDLLEDREAGDNPLPLFDYVVMNGVFTERRSLSFEEMLTYFKRLLKQVWSKTARGVAFNVMSKQVDWEREDLFHLPLDTLATFLTQDLTRDFIIRNDYHLYEYTTYVYR